MCWLVVIYTTIIVYYMHKCYISKPINSMAVLNVLSNPICGGSWWTVRYILTTQ